MRLQDGRRYKGFTLAELLIAVAVIAVLVAVAIPVFAKQLEKSRRAVDMANARNIMAVLGTGINAGDIQFQDKYVPGSTEQLACTAVVVGKTGMKVYASGNIKVKGNDYTVGGHERLKEYIEASGIKGYVIKSKSPEGSDGWNFFAVFIYSDGAVRIGSGTDKGFDDYRENTFEDHADYWKKSSASNIEKAMELRS